MSHWSAKQHLQRAVAGVMFVLKLRGGAVMSAYQLGSFFTYQLLFMTSLEIVWQTTSTN